MKGRGLLALLLALLGPTTGTRAQDAPPAPAASERAAVEPIPAGSIAAEAEVLTERLREFEAAFAPDPRLAAIEQDLPDFSKQLLTDRRALTRQLDLGSDLGALEEARRTWKLRAKNLADWQHTLVGRADAIDERVSELETARQAWSATQHAAGSPAALRQVVARLLEAIAATSSRGKRELARILPLQAEIAKLQDAAADMLERLATARSRARTELLDRDQAPLWQIAAESRRTEPLAERLSRELGRSVEVTRTHATKHRTALVLITLLGVAVLAAAVSMRPRVRVWALEDPAFASTVHLFERPLSTALVSVLPWLLMLDPPSSARGLVGTILLAPAMRVLLPWVPEQGRRVFWVLIPLYVVDRARDLLLAFPVIERLLLVLEFAAALGCALWLLRPARLAALPHATGPRPWLGVALRLGAGLLVAGLLLVIGGWVALGRLLGEGVLRSAYSGLALVAVSAGAQGLLHAALRVRPLRLLHLVEMQRSAILTWSRRLAVGAALLGWAYVTLAAFAANELVLGFVRSALAAKLEIGEIGISLGDVLGFCLVVGIGLLLARGLRTVVDVEVTPRVTLPRGVGYALGASLQYAVALLVFFFALGALGIEANRLALIGGALGVGIGFGLQNVINNFVSGLILLVERPIQVGDYVETANLGGEVKRIGIRSSTVRTWQGAEVILPNSFLISEHVINWTMSDRHRRIEIPVGVSYGADPEQVLALLEGIARANPEALADPPPLALFRGFGESALDFELRVWTANFDRGFVLQSQIGVEIHRALKQAGIEIPFPQRDLHLRSVDPGAARRLAGSDDC